MEGNLRIASPLLTLSRRLCPLLRLVDPSLRMPFVWHDRALASAYNLELRISLLLLRLNTLRLALLPLEQLLQGLSTVLVLARLCLVHSVPNPHELPVNVLQRCAHGIRDRSLQLLLDQPRGEWPERLVQQIVFRVTDSELERVDLDLHVLDPEHARLVFPGGRDVGSDRQAVPTKQNIRETGVGQLGHTLLLAEVECDVLHIRLNLPERERELVVLLVADGIVWRELDVIVRLHRDDIGEEIHARQREVLDDDVKRVVCVLDARDGDIADLEVFLSQSSVNLGY